MAFLFERVPRRVGESSGKVRNYSGGVLVRKKDEDLKIYRVTVQVSKKEKEKLFILANEKGMSVSDYIRVYCIHEPYNKFFGGK